MAIFRSSEIFPSIFNRHCFIVCIGTMIILISINQIINTSTETEYQQCDATRIQEHFMSNLSASVLLQRTPRSNLFEYEIVNRNFCGKNDIEIDLLIFIISKSSSYERRNAIRRTYGNLNNIFKYIDEKSSRIEVRFLFMIEIDRTRLESIRFEQHVYKDIIQVRLPEEYSMDTYRDLAMFDWSSKHCSRARFIFKMDELIFLNPFLLFKFINENENDRLNLDQQPSLDIEFTCPIIEAPLPKLYGFIHSNENVLRKIEQSEKYLVSKDEYPCDIYPNYLNDFAYLISSDARNLILCVFYRQPNILFPLSNIYLTGILAEYLNIERQPLVNYEMNLDLSILCENFFTKTNPLQALACITNIKSSKKMFEYYHIYWEIIIKSQVENKKKEG